MDTAVRVSNHELQRQISDLTTRLEQIGRDVAEIKAMVRALEERVRHIENNEAGAHPIMESRIDAAWRKIEEHDKRIEVINQAIARLEQTNRMLAWLGGILGSTVLIWLVTQILGVIR